MTLARTLAWSARWKAIRPNAQYNEAFGLETAWRSHADDWGYPLEDVEQKADHNGQLVPGRTFHKVGMVVWNPSTGAEVLGWL